MIVLSIGNDVWVSPLVEHRRGHTGEFLQVCNLRLELMSTLHLAEDNKDHMETLYQNCEKVSGVCYDHYRASAIIGNDLDNLFHPRGGKVEWAFLPLYPPRGNEPPTNSVWCTFYSSLSQIFIQRDDRTSLLDRLIRDMDYDITSMIKEKYEKYATIFEEYYEIGLPVAVMESIDKTWSRAIITGKYECENDVAFDVFFVDHGDSARLVRMKDMFPLKKEFVTKLPFQIILVRSAHVVPVGESLDVNSGNLSWTCKANVEALVGKFLIYDDLAQKLEVTAMQKVGYYTKNGIELCRMYDAFIVGEGQENELGEFVVEQKLGKYVPGAKKELANWKTYCLEFWNKAVDKGLNRENSDEEEDNVDGFGDDEDFDVYLGNDEGSSQDDMKTAKQILTDFGIAKEILDSIKPHVPKKSIEGSSSAQEEKSSDETKGTSNDAASSKIKAPKILIPMTSEIHISIGPMLKKPTVEWSQTPELIVIYIHILDLLKYKLVLDWDCPQNRLIFRSEVPDGYGFDLSLVGKVRPMMEKLCTGQCLTVKLQKLSANFRWPYLLMGKPSLHWLKNRLDDKFTDTPTYKGYDSDDDDENSNAVGRTSYGDFVADDDSEDEDEEVDFSDGGMSDDEEEETELPGQPV